jgi:hypothetical protein
MDDIITTPDVVTTARRIIADALTVKADATTAYFPDGDKYIRNKDILATILWDIITQGYALYADGKELRPESYSDWLSTVKYLVSHLDGPVSGEDGAGVNVFKVYVGIDMSKV